MCSCSQLRTLTHFGHAYIFLSNCFQMYLETSELVAIAVWPKLCSSMLCGSGASLAKLVIVK